MELKEKTTEVMMKVAMRILDKAIEGHPEMKDWRPIFEATYQCLLSLKDTNALRFFAMQCICALDLPNYGMFEENFLSEIPLIRQAVIKNTELYEGLNDGIIDPD